MQTNIIGNQEDNRVSGLTLKDESYLTEDDHHIPTRSHQALGFFVEDSEEETNKHDDPASFTKKKVQMETVLMQAQASGTQVGVNPLCANLRARQKKSSDPFT
jgi:hypothetical protein